MPYDKYDKHATVRELAYKMRGLPTQQGRGQSPQPRFAFLLGAGASRQSGVKTAGEMVRDFKRALLEARCAQEFETDDEREEWLQSQPWFKHNGNEYSHLFGEFEPKELGRQRYIEGVIEGHEPSFGYVVLANLLARNYVNTVLTTNFDDLVYSACTSYTGIRPIVYAYGVLASEMRVTTQRPKILKLHGDYLYSALKNTEDELNARPKRKGRRKPPAEVAGPAGDPNMTRQLSQVLNEYGLVVVGYGGGDKSVMDALGQISEKNDLYWCYIKGTEPAESVIQLLKAKGGFLVEIDGFDQMMNEIRQIIGFDVVKMFDSFQDRLDHMVEKFKEFATTYSADILDETVKAVELQAKREQKRVKSVKQLRLFTRALQAQDKGDPEEAKRLYQQIIEQNPNEPVAYNNLAVILDNQREAERNTASSPEVEHYYRKAIELDGTNATPYVNLGALLANDPARLDEAEAYLRHAVEMSPGELEPRVRLAQLLYQRRRVSEAVTILGDALDTSPPGARILTLLASFHMKLGHARRSAQYAAKARKLIEPDDWYLKAWLESLDGNREATIENLNRAVQADENARLSAQRNPFFAWLRKDKRFREIVAPPDPRPRAPKPRRKPAKKKRA